MITQKTRLNMVIGFPLEHTFSPVLHHAIYQTQKQNAILLAFANKQLLPLIKAIKSLSVELTAVTMPYKEKVLRYLDHISPEVDILKAANTIIQRDNQLYGYNTDVFGIEYALRDIVIDNKNVLIIGAGGAARAAAYVLSKNDANIIWLNRTKAKSKKLANEMGGTVIDYTDLSKHTIQLIINTTPLGMYPHLTETPLPDYAFNHDQIIFDMIYNPIHTTLLNDAKKAGATVISGLDMFIAQGLKQIELWLNKKIITNEMIEHARQAIDMRTCS